jgi:hypothetical protein
MRFELARVAAAQVPRWTVIRSNHEVTRGRYCGKLAPLDTNALAVVSGRAEIWCSSCVR